MKARRKPLGHLLVLLSSAFAEIPWRGKPGFQLRLQSAYPGRLPSTFTAASSQGAFLVEPPGGASLEGNTSVITGWGSCLATKNWAFQTIGTWDPRWARSCNGYTSLQGVSVRLWAFKHASPTRIFLEPCLRRRRHTFGKSARF